jgi:hypothetical protein
MCQLNTQIQCPSNDLNIKLALGTSLLLQRNCRMYILIAVCQKSQHTYPTVHVLSQIINENLLYSSNIVYELLGTKP